VSARPGTPDGPILSLRAYAKINLTLEVLGRRDDGYHEIVSVTQLISLADDLTLAPAADFTIEMTPPLVSAEENLVRRAAEAFTRDRNRPLTGRLSIAKRIPLAAGLGGGSSDAAAALRLFGKRWGHHASHSDLRQIAAAIGSDVPLFFGHGTSLIRGRGDVVERLPSPPTFWLALFVPSGSPPDKTRALYRALSPEDFTDGAAPAGLQRALSGLQPMTDAPLVNAFDRAAGRVYAGYADLRARLSSAISRPVRMTGAGPTLFAIFEDRAGAAGAVEQAAAIGVTALVAQSIARRPEVRAAVPQVARS
jgi:4-diphosphocytidyl-2-C-methyl-D-erythritol kinase